MPTPPVDTTLIKLLEEKIIALENVIGADCVSVHSPIMYGLEQRFNQALLNVPTRRRVLAIFLQTPGGSAEVADRMVQASRHLYSEVHFYIPNQAMSAGTIWAMSGDRIFMNYFSVLGPIDPQILKGDKFIPALAYLSEFEALLEKAKTARLTAAEFAILDKFDIGEIHSFKQARELSIDLLEKWLSAYKFKDWTVTETNQTTVTEPMKKRRAKEIAQALVDHARWHSHSRCISMNTLVRELNIKIEDYWADTRVKDAVHGYWDLFSDYLTQKGVQTFVHSRYFV